MYTHDNIKDVKKLVLGVTVLKGAENLQTPLAESVTICIICPLV